MMVKYRNLKARTSSPCFGVLAVAVAKFDSVNKPQHLARFLGRSLIEHSVRTALATGASEVVVVLSSASEETRQALRGLPVHIVTCGENQDGIGDAISVGISAFSSKVDSVVITLDNRPGVTAAHLKQLAYCLSVEDTIVASAYKGLAGVPCAFSRAEFINLLALSGYEGARELVRTRCTSLIHFEAANIRLETPPVFLEISRELPTTTLKSEPSYSFASRAPPSSHRYGFVARQLFGDAQHSLSLEYLWSELKHSRLLNFS